MLTSNAMWSWLFAVEKQTTRNQIKQQTDVMMNETDTAMEWPDEDDQRVRLLDVRPLIENGLEPFPAISAAVERLRAGEFLCLRAPFEPVPLYSVMAARGFDSRSRRVVGSDGRPCWEVLFFRRDSGIEDGESALSEEGPVTLDLRETAESELRRRVLDTLETLRYDDVLLVLHSHPGANGLVDSLADRGFSHRAEDTEQRGACLRIWRNR